MSGGVEADAHDLAEEAYIQRARRDPAVARMLKTTLSALGFHLWCMTREERAVVTVDQMRERKNLPHGYITDAEIRGVIDAEVAREWVDPISGKAAA